MGPEPHRKEETFAVTTPTRPTPRTSARSQPHRLRPAPETTLFAVVGFSPAILTETAWALAHEKPPVLPDRVVAVTSRLGREKIRQELFDSGAWEKLRRAPRARQTGKSQ
jgi:hypothetical protein